MMIMIRAMMKEMGSKLSGIGDMVVGWCVDVDVLNWRLGLRGCWWFGLVLMLVDCGGRKKERSGCGNASFLYLCSMRRVYLGEGESWGVREWQA
jgi:hypothetical protein